MVTGIHWIMQSVHTVMFCSKQCRANMTHRGMFFIRMFILYVWMLVLTSLQCQWRVCGRMASQFHHCILKQYFTAQFGSFLTNCFLKEHLHWMYPQRTYEMKEMKTCVAVEIQCTALILYCIKSVIHLLLIAVFWTHL